MSERSRGVVVRWTEFNVNPIAFSRLLSPRKGASAFSLDAGRHTQQSCSVEELGTVQFNLNVKPKI